MKRIYSVLLSSCLITSFVIAQQAQPEKTDNEKTVIVVKKKVDEKGETVVEKIVLNGNTEGRIQTVDGVTIFSDPLDKVEVEAKIFGTDEQEVTTTRDVNVTVADDNGKRVITVDVDGNTEIFTIEPGENMSDEDRARLAEKGVNLMEGTDEVIELNGDHAYVYSYRLQGMNDRLKLLTERLDRLNPDNLFESEDLDVHARIIKGMHSRDANCIALGVFVNADGGPLRISGIIDGSGAEDGGLQKGDVLKAIDKAPIDNFKELHEVLGAYEPGDVVSVDYERDGVTGNVSAELRSWGDLPDYENNWRAMVKCGDPDYQGDFNFLEMPKVEKKVIIIKKNVQDNVEEGINELVPPQVKTSVNDYTLQLENFSAFPNPSDGKFTIQFRAEPLPLTVSVIDASGREVFRDKMPYFNGIYNKEVNLQSAPRGVMFISVVQEGKQFTDKVILQ